jgi:hypothetical protein
MFGSLDLTEQFLNPNGVIPRTRDVARARQTALPLLKRHSDQEKNSPEERLMRALDALLASTFSTGSDRPTAQSEANKSNSFSTC